MAILEINNLQSRCQGPASAGDQNVLALLAEVGAAIKRLVREGESTIIDLRSAPMGPEDETYLRAILGRGELEASINALGLTTICETAFSGVWLIEHFNDAKERVAFQLEITQLPELLKAQDEDIYAAAERFEEVFERLVTREK